MAKTKFEEALQLSTELNDEEKVRKSEEWIVSCEQELEEEETGGFCAGSSLIVSILLGGILRYLSNDRTNNKTEGEKQWT